MAQSEDPIAEAFLGFHCNFQGADGKCCGTALTERGWITACSHLFCDSHAREWFVSHEDCPICRGPPVKLVNADFSDHKRKRTMLVGLTPLEAMQAVDISLSFWIGQKELEFNRTRDHTKQMSEHLKKVESGIKESLASLETTCNALESERRHLQKQVKDSEAEQKQTENELKALEVEVKEAEAQSIELQQRVAIAERQDVFRRPLSGEKQSPNKKQRRDLHSPVTDTMRDCLPHDEEPPKRDSHRRSTTAAWRAGGMAPSPFRVDLAGGPRSPSSLGLGLTHQSHLDSGGSTGVGRSLLPARTPSFAGSRFTRKKQLFT